MHEPLPSRLGKQGRVDEGELGRGGGSAWLVGGGAGLTLLLTSEPRFPRSPNWAWEVHLRGQMERLPARLYRWGGTRGVGAVQSREVMVGGKLGECREALRSTVSSSDGEVRGQVRELLSALILLTG